MIDDRFPRIGGVVLATYSMAQLMLFRGTMSRTVLALVLVAASTSVASAGAYVGLGVGTSPATSTDSDNSGVTTQADGRSGRLLLGYRFGRIAVEGSAGRFDVMFNQNYPFSSTQLGVGGKYSLPLGDNFEAFGRGGLQRTSLSGETSGGYDASGGGYYLGAGIEYRLNLIVAAGSVFVDYQYASSSLTDGRGISYDATNRMWTMGVTFSL